MTDWEVLVPMEIDPAGPTSIADFASCTGMEEYGSHEAAVADIERYDAVIVRVAPLDAAVLDRADNLQVIAKHGSGLDNVDIAAASQRDIVVCNTPGANARSVAEHAIALVFGLARSLRGADSHVRSGGWNRSEFTGTELREKTLGIYGFGAIGREVASLADGIGMDVRVHDSHKDDDEFPASVERSETLPDLFEQSDVVSLHAPLTAETRGSVSTAELQRLGSDGLLINTARGAVIDEEALIEGLEKGVIGGAGLDTFTEEPPREDHPLFGREDVLVTPHSGGNSHRALREMSTRAAANVRTVYEGGVPETTVNAEQIER